MAQDPVAVEPPPPVGERDHARGRDDAPLTLVQYMVAPRATYALCPCGQSANKPFCDGTHARSGFDGTVTAEREAGAGRRRMLVGTGIVMTDEPELSVHAGLCGTRLTQ